MAKSSAMPQHKKMAMGQKVGFKKGGSIGAAGPTGGVKASAMPPRKTGMPMPPPEVAKQQNGVPGYKKGGKVDADGDEDMAPKRGGRMC